MSREQIIEAMAGAIWEQADDEVGWRATLSLAATGEVFMQGQVDYTRETAQLALTALEAAIPGLADLLDGKATIVPNEATAEQHLAVADALASWGAMNGHGKTQQEIRMSAGRAIVSAMLAATPYRRPNDG